MPAKIYSILCTKGGVGKTTVCTNLSAILADMGQRVLLVDTDPQQSLSRAYPIQEQAPFGLTQLYRHANAEGCISKTVIPNMDIVINDDSGGDKGVIANFLRESFMHIQYLYIALQGVKDNYDYILIDTQGAKGSVQEESIIYASDVILSPVPPQVLDSREFVIGTVGLINKFKPKPGFPNLLGKPVPPMRILINKWNRTSNAYAISNYLRAEFDRSIDAQITVLNTVIPELQVYAEAVGKNIPVHRYETSRRGATSSALTTMLELVYELEPKLMGISPTWTTK